MYFQCYVFSFVLLFPLRSATVLELAKWIEDHVVSLYGALNKVGSANLRILLTYFELLIEYF